MEQKDRPKYEKPSLVAFDLYPIETQARCNPVGSVPSGNQCMSGGNAGGKCQAGTVAGGSQCHPGTVAGGKCQGGSVAGGKCQGGSVGG